jgi:hypothetical protein
VCTHPRRSHLTLTLTLTCTTRSPCTDVRGSVSSYFRRFRRLGILLGVQPGNSFIYSLLWDIKGWVVGCAADQTSALMPTTPAKRAALAEPGTLHPKEPRKSGRPQSIATHRNNKQTPQQMTSGTSLSCGVPDADALDSRRCPVPAGESSGAVVWYIIHVYNFS